LYNECMEKRCYTAISLHKSLFWGLIQLAV
jgi:hypothetical protein